MSRRNDRYCRSRARAALTLIELLVVIGIIAVLAGILIPVISRMHENVRSTDCLNRLRQMTIAAQLYVADNDGSYPVAYWFGGDGGIQIVYCWDLTTIDAPNQPTRIVPGLLWNCGDLARIQQCPSFVGKANWLDDPYTGYNYNTSYIGHGQYESIPASANASSVRQPSTTALFGDGQWVGGADKFMRAPFPNPGDDSFSGRWAGTQGFRHLGKTNVAFCDGHAETLSGRFTDNIDGGENVGPGTGFLSKDNSAYAPK